MAKITYNRVHAGDPEETEWNGKPFTHGQAVEFDGRTTEGKGFLEAARGNPWFSIEGEEAEEGDGGGGKPPKKKDVDSPEGYRAYAIDWINKARTLRDLQGRWDGEADLRERVGWGTDDQHLIDPILQPKIENMKQAEG